MNLAKLGERSAGMALPELDATQKKVIATLEKTREYWQITVDQYNPLQVHESVDSRYEKDKALRRRVPRESHAAWKSPPKRPSGADFVLADNAGRQQHLVPLRMGRMAVSPFCFLRGAASAMAWDLSHTPITGIQTIIDGDAHINNFGLYGTAQRDVVLDLNDFDEALPGPWEWDLKRLVASVDVAARANGFNKHERRTAVMECVAGYRFNIQRFRPMGFLGLWSLYGYADRKPKVINVPNKTWTLIQKTVENARATTNETLLSKVAQRLANGRWRFREDPPILTRVSERTGKRVIESLNEYIETVPLGYRQLLQRYAVQDVAHRVVGLGSVGTRPLSRSSPWQRRLRSAFPSGEGSNHPCPRSLFAGDYLEVAASWTPCGCGTTHAAILGGPFSGLHHHRQPPLFCPANEKHEGGHATGMAHR
jgi:hypothetical protein